MKKSELKSLIKMIVTESHDLYLGEEHPLPQDTHATDLNELTEDTGVVIQTVKGPYKFWADEDREEDNIKLFHYVKGPDGKEHDVNISPYEINWKSPAMIEKVKKWIESDMPNIKISENNLQENKTIMKKSELTQEGFIQDKLNNLFKINFRKLIKLLEKSGFSKDDEYSFAYSKVLDLTTDGDDEGIVTVSFGSRKWDDITISISEEGFDEDEFYTVKELSKKSNKEILDIVKKINSHVYRTDRPSPNSSAYKAYQQKRNDRRSLEENKHSNTMKKSELKSLLKVIIQEVVAVKQKRIDETKRLSGFKKPPTSKNMGGVRRVQNLNEASSDEAWELVSQPVPEIQQFVKQMGYGNNKQSVAKITSIIDRVPSTQIPAASISKLKNLANKGNDAQTLKSILQISGRPDAEQQYTKLMQARDAGEGRNRDVSGYIQYVKSGNYDPPVLLKLPTGVYVIGGRTRLYAALALGVPANVKIISVNNFKQGVAEGSLEEVDRRGFLKGMGAAAVAGGAGYMGGLKEDIMSMIREAIDESDIEEIRTKGTIGSKFKVQDASSPTGWVVKNHKTIPDGTPTEAPKGPYQKLGSNPNMGRPKKVAPVSSVGGTDFDTATRGAIENILTAAPNTTDNDIIQQLSSSASEEEVSLNLDPTFVKKTADALRKELSADTDNQLDDAPESDLAAIASSEEKRKAAQRAVMIKKLQARRAAKQPIK